MSNESHSEKSNLQMSNYDRRIYDALVRLGGEGTTANIAVELGRSSRGMHASLQAATGRVDWLGYNSAAWYFIDGHIPDVPNVHPDYFPPSGRNEHYARTQSGELIGPYETSDQCIRECAAANAEDSK